MVRAELVRVGSILREKREQTEMSLREVALSLRIREAVLGAIEMGYTREQEVEINLPPFNYMKGFVRSYGNWLGLDGDGLARQFEEEMQESWQESLQESWQESSAVPSQEGSEKAISDDHDLVAREEQEERWEKEEENGDDKSSFLSFFVTAFSGSVKTPIAIGSAVCLVALVWLFEGTSRRQASLESREEVQDNVQVESLAKDYNAVLGEKDRRNLHKETEGAKVTPKPEQGQEEEQNLKPREEKVETSGEAVAKAKPETPETPETPEVEEEPLKNLAGKDLGAEARIWLRLRDSFRGDSIGFTLEQGGKEMTRFSLRGGEKEPLPEGAHLVLRGERQAWQEVQFIVDGMKISWVIAGDEEEQKNKLKIDGYGIVSGDWKWSR